MSLLLLYGDNYTPVSATGTSSVELTTAGSASVYVSATGTASAVVTSAATGKAAMFATSWVADSTQGARVTIETTGNGKQLIPPSIPVEYGVQTITLSATGGTWTATLLGETTAPIAFNATAASVQSALEALPSINPGDVSVSGGAGIWTVTYRGQFTGGNVPVLTVSSGGLTGGSSSAVVVVRPTRYIPRVSITMPVPVLDSRGRPHG